MDELTVVGGGLGGLTAAITATEAGARVVLYEARDELGGRGRTAPAPYRVNEGPHAFYRGGPHWTWLKSRRLLQPLAGIPPAEGLRLRYHHQGKLRRLPPIGMIRQVLRKRAPVDQDFFGWASALAGEDTASAAASYVGVATFHHDPGSLSAAFVQERLHRAGKFPPEAHYARGGWGAVLDRMAALAGELGVKLVTGSRVDELPGGGPVIVATSLASARKLLGDDTLTWPSGRTALVDLAVTSRKGDAFAVSDLDRPGWVERFTAQDKSLAPDGEELIQAQVPLAPEEKKDEGVLRVRQLLELGYPGWSERTTWMRTAVAAGRTGAVDPPGTTWRDRPAIARGDGVYLVGDQVAAPGVLSEVSFTSAVQAVRLALE